ncbi:MAG: UMP kinase [Candidatus Oxydemutatoraceae bacterium WSBS_2016_MAG_OTU14]
MSAPLQYKRILLKISGEALTGKSEDVLDLKFLNYLTSEICTIHAQGVQVAIVIGGGNIFRGKQGHDKLTLDRTAGDHMGMLATVINSLAMQGALEAQGIETRVMSAIPINSVCESYIRRRAIRHLEKNRIVFLAAGTGNPYFTTDTAASLRAAELTADILLKATNVDGIYSADPRIDKNAKFHSQLSYKEVLKNDLGVMDATAFVLCRENKIPLRVFNITEPSAMLKIVQGESVGTLVS